MGTKCQTFTTSLRIVMSKIGPIKARNPSRIDIDQAEDVLHWCRELGCNEARLQEAVHEVGTSVEAVRREITGRWK